MTIDYAERLFKYVITFKPSHALHTALDDADLA